jgi:two-component system clock-associated histidine kinase SasA
MEPVSPATQHPEACLQLLLFLDKRPSSSEKNRQIRSYLKELHEEFPFDLQIVDVGEQPDLAEHFKLVATPTLIKIYPEPQQTLAGSNLVSQVEVWWPRWRISAEERIADPQSALATAEQSALGAVARSVELLKLQDEGFRLKQETEELQAQLKFKDRLIAMLAHDLRNPLTAVAIALETLELMVEPKDDGRAAKLTPELTAQLLKHARTQSKVIDRMITDILQAAHTTGSQLQIYPQKLDLQALCEEVLERFLSLLEPKSPQITTDIPTDLPQVFADSERIRQVLVNLLDNALKYTPPDGTIRVSALHRTTQKVQISVCDDGPGIPEENRERIFEDRFRLQRDEDKEGYGIGLALCRRIVNAHYGQIWVDSVPGQGSCFHFTLPVFRP